MSKEINGMVKAKTKVFVGNGLREAGSVFHYEGPANRHLEEIKKPKGKSEDKS